MKVGKVFGTLQAGRKPGYGLVGQKEVSWHTLGDGAAVKVGAMWCQGGPLQAYRAMWTNRYRMLRHPSKDGCRISS